MRLERTPSSALAFVIALRVARALCSREVLLAIAVAFLVALPWHLRSLLVYGRAFLDQYLVFHVLGRFQAPLEGHEGGLLHYFDVYRYNAGWLAAIDTAGVTLALILAFLKRDRLLAAVVVLPLSAFALVSAQGTKIGWYLTPVYRAPRLPLRWRCPEQFTAAAASSSNTMFLTTARKFACSAACRPLRQGAFRCFTRWDVSDPAVRFYLAHEVETIDQAELEHLPAENQPFLCFTFKWSAVKFLQKHSHTKLGIAAFTSPLRLSSTTDGRRRRKRRM